MNSKMIDNVYQDLKGRRIHPSGTFDEGGRWYAEHSDLISVRAPSRNWLYSELKACRTKKYVKAVAKKFDCQTEQELRQHV